MSGRIVVEAFLLVTWWAVRDRAARRDPERSSARDTEGWPSSEFTVAGALLESAEGLLLVRNQRRSGRTDWSTPGGVIDPTDASLRAGLAREVLEETGLRVTEWEGPLYEVRAIAHELGWVMRCEVHRALAYEGDVVVDDPDGIVVEATFAPPTRAPSSSRCARPGCASRWPTGSSTAGDPTTRASTRTTSSAPTATSSGWCGSEQGRRQHPARRPRCVLRVGRDSTTIRHSRAVR